MQKRCEKANKMLVVYKEQHDTISVDLDFYDFRVGRGSKLNTKIEAMHEQDLHDFVGTLKKEFPDADVKIRKMFGPELRRGKYKLPKHFPWSAWVDVCFHIQKELLK